VERPGLHDGIFLPCKCHTLTLRRLCGRASNGSFHAGRIVLTNPIMVHPPYNFALTTEVARFYSVLGRRHGSAYRRTLRVGDRLSLIEISDAGTPEAPQLQARVLAGAVEQDALQQALARMLNLHVDLTPFYEFAR